MGPLTPKQSKTLTYRVIVGPDVKLGRAKNQATVNGTVSGVSTSAGPSIAVVDINEGLFSKRGMIIGKVFEDIDQDGIQDRDEKGIPYVALILEDGTMVTTDEFGRYSIPDVSCGMHVLKLDQRMLPGGPQARQRRIIFRHSADTGGDGRRKRLNTTRAKHTFVPATKDINILCGTVLQTLEPKSSTTADDPISRRTIFKLHPLIKFLQQTHNIIIN